MCACASASLPSNIVYLTLSADPVTYASRNRHVTLYIRNSPKRLFCFWWFCSSTDVYSQPLITEGNTWTQSFHFFLSFFLRLQPSDSHFAVDFKCLLSYILDDWWPHNIDLICIYFYTSLLFIYLFIYLYFHNCVLHIHYVTQLYSYWLSYLCGMQQTL